jgi:hypothetical protein
VTASRTGLAILAAIALALGFLHLAAGGRAPVASRVAFAGLGAGPGPHTLVWTRPGADPVRVTGGEATPWTMAAPYAGPVDAHVVADVLATVQTARWQRRAAVIPLGAPPVRFTLAIDDAVLEVRGDAPGVGSWIKGPGGAYLVDAWVAAALDRDAVALRVRAVTSIDRDRITRLELRGGGVEVVLACDLAAGAGATAPATSGCSGALALRTADGATIRLRPEPVAAVLDALAGLRVEALPPPTTDPPPAPTDAIGIDTGADAAPAAAAVGAHEQLGLRGECPDHPGLLWITSTAAGEVCVAAAGWSTLAVAAQLLASGSLDLVEPRPVVGPIAAVTLPSGARLRWRGATVEVSAETAPDTWFDAEAAEVDRVVAALTEPAVTVERVPIATTAPRATIEVTTGGSSAGVHLLAMPAPGTLVRAGSPIALRLSPAATAALALDAGALRDRGLWRTEPALLQQVTIRDAAGATLLELAAGDPRTTALADALAAPRAVRFLAAAPTTRRRIELVYAPPPVAGAGAEHHVILLGTARADGCPAVVDGQAVVLEPAVCRLLENPRPP